MVQTPDTDLNQPVSRDYQKREGMEHIMQMRDGKAVPRCPPKTCIDNMVDVLSQRELHINAAVGYVKTGWLCSLSDSSGDQFIVREAGAFWKELGMRTKVNAAVAAVRAKVAAGRLQWTESDVQRLIKPHPRRKKC